MERDKILKIAGTVAIVAGSTALFFAGVGEGAIVGIVGATSVLIGVIAALFR